MKEDLSLVITQMVRRRIRPVLESIIHKEIDYYLLEAIPSNGMKCCYLYQQKLIRKIE